MIVITMFVVIAVSIFTMINIEVYVAIIIVISLVNFIMDIALSCISNG